MLRVSVAIWNGRPHRGRPPAPPALPTVHDPRRPFTANAQTTYRTEPLSTLHLPLMRMSVSGSCIKTLTSLPLKAHFHTLKFTSIHSPLTLNTDGGMGFHQAEWSVFV
ncbi:unnamed protein product [Arctogadus glacialis]